MLNLINIVVYRNILTCKNCLALQVKKLLTKIDDIPEIFKKLWDWSRLKSKAK